MENNLKVRLYKEVLDDLKKELEEANSELIKYNKLILKKELFERILKDEYYFLDKEYEIFLSEVNDSIKELEKNYIDWELKKRMRENEINEFKSMMVEQGITDIEALSN